MLNQSVLRMSMIKLFEALAGKAGQDLYATVARVLKSLQNLTLMRNPSENLQHRILSMNYPRIFC